MGIGINLKIALKEYDLTVAELSRKTGISTNTLYAMIRRDNQKIDPQMLKKICDNSEITVYDLLDNYEDYIVKYCDPSSSKADIEIGDYVMTQIGNDDNLEEIIEIYGELNNKGKEVACERVRELKEIPRYTEPDRLHRNEQLNAAHKRTDIEIPDGVDTSEDDIMDDEDF